MNTLDIQFQFEQFQSYDKATLLLSKVQDEKWGMDKLSNFFLRDGQIVILFPRHKKSSCDPTRPFEILEKKITNSTKAPPDFDRAQISTHFYSLSTSNESDAILTKSKYTKLQLYNFQQSKKGQPKLKVLLLKAMLKKANLKFIQGTGYTFYLSIWVHHRTI